MGQTRLHFHATNQAQTNKTLRPICTYVRIDGIRSTILSARTSMLRNYLIIKSSDSPLSKGAYLKKMDIQLFHCCYIVIVVLFCFLSSGGRAKIKLKLPHFHVSDTCVSI